LKILSEAGHLNFPWIHDGEPEDTVFKALAVVPMTRRRPGVIYEKPPFDVEELIRLIKKESDLTPVGVRIDFNCLVQLGG
jgi:hypothetical protein